MPSGSCRRSRPDRVFFGPQGVDASPPGLARAPRALSDRSRLRQHPLGDRELQGEERGGHLQRVARTAMQAHRPCSARSSSRGCRRQGIPVVVPNSAQGSISRTSAGVRSARTSSRPALSRARAPRSSCRAARASAEAPSAPRAGPGSGRRRGGGVKPQRRVDQQPWSRTAGFELQALERALDHDHRAQHGFSPGQARLPTEDPQAQRAPNFTRLQRPDGGAGPDTAIRAILLAKLQRRDRDQVSAQVANTTQSARWPPLQGPCRAASPWRTGGAGSSPAQTTVNFRSALLSPPARSLCQSFCLESLAGAGRRARRTAPAPAAGPESGPALLGALLDRRRSRILPPSRAESMP